MRWGAIIILGLFASPTAAQEAAPTEDRLAAERLMFLPPPEPKRRCKADPEDETAIVVCGRTTETERYRVPSTTEDAPLSPEANRTGVPHVGQSLVTHLPDCSPGHGCKSMGWAPPPIYYIDVTALPAPPPGSDAEKIAKGEMRAP